MKVNLSIELTDAHKTLTAGDIRQALEKVPDGANVRINRHSGDRGYSDWFTITLSWSEER